MALSTKSRFDGAFDGWVYGQGPSSFEATLALVGQTGGTSDYAFFNPMAMLGSATGRNWAGPDHWKFRAAPKVNGADEGKAKGKSKAKKAEFSIDFNAPRVNPLQLVPKSKAATTLASAPTVHPTKPGQLVWPKKAATTLTDKDAHRLPEDVHFDATRLVSLFLKPHVRVMPSKRLATAAAPEGSLGYDYNNPNDVSFVAAAGAEGEVNEDYGGDHDLPDFDNFGTHS
jgi:hypothetical protein